MERRKTLAKKRIGFILTVAFVGSASGLSTAVISERVTQPDHEETESSMNYNSTRNRDSTRIILDPPTFSPPPEMRSAYLERRKGEIETLMDHARAGEWKPVMTVVNHVRGTGAMYGFENVGKAAESVVKAVQNGDADSLRFMEEYARILGETFV